MDPTERLLRACRREPVDRPPVWLMRQAGRYQASYQAVRSKVSFMELCRSPDLCCRVTVQAVDELGVDAAILFSDILVPLESMGVEVSFRNGPCVEPAARTVEAIDGLRVEGVAESVGYVYDAVRTIRQALAGRVPLLGFSGSPWTLASYLVEGGSSRHLHELKRLMYEEPAALERLLSKLASVVIDYLRMQIDAGVDAVQIFDSWGGALAEPEWRQFSGRFTQEVLTALRDTGTPRIHYINGGGHLLEATAELDCEVLSVDWRTPLSEVAQRTGGRYALQGNLDPAILRASPEVIRAGVQQTLDSYGNRPGLVFNLGHGITPDATVGAAQALVKAVHDLGPAYGG